MQRTSIFAHSNKLIYNAPRPECPTCSHYQQEIRQLRSQLEGVGRCMGNQGEGVGVVAGWGLDQWERELGRVKGCYEGLLRRVGMLGKECEELQEENIGLIKQNKRLKQQISKLTNQLQQQSCNHPQKQNNAPPPKAAPTPHPHPQPHPRTPKQMYLSQLDTNTNMTDKSLYLHNDLGLITNRNGELEEFMRRRVEIQGKRHARIEHLGAVLRDF